MTRVVVLYGGISAERAVSLATGAEVIGALRESGFVVDPVDVGHDLGAVISDAEAGCGVQRAARAFR
jgi:D-alanine-D-alanine ligase